MKLSKNYRKLKLMRNGSSFASPESGHYEVERTSILLPITLADEYNHHWKDSGVYYDEIPEQEEEVKKVITTDVDNTGTTPRKPTNAEIRAKAKELGMTTTNTTKVADMLEYIRENIKE